MRKLIVWITNLVERLFPEYSEDMPTTPSRHRSIVYLDVPDRAIAIYRWYGLYYEANTRQPLPNNCMFVIDSLSTMPEWKHVARQYFTFNDWFSVLYSIDPEGIFKERIKWIAANHDLS